MKPTPAAGILLLLALMYPAPGHSQSAGTEVSWVHNDPSDWPHITMVNQISYTDANYPMAGCAFLLDTGDEILAATAKHVLLYFKSEAMSSVSFRGTLKEWRMFPKDDSSSVTVVDKLINEDDKESLEDFPAREDWLIFTVREYPDNMQPLRLRSTPLRSGEPVFIVGWRYTDEGSQSVYGGKYVESDNGSVLISAPALTNNKMPGLSGAPVIDADGYVIGLMSSKAGKMQRLASVDYAHALLRDRRLSGVELSTPTVHPSVPRETEVPKCPLEPEVCARQMTERFKKRGWIGITPNIDPRTGAISVTHVFSGSPAQEAGFEEGDIVRGINGMMRDRTTDDAFMKAYDSFRVGATVTFNVEREGAQLDLEVRLEPIPERILAQWVNEHQLKYHAATKTE